MAQITAALVKELRDKTSAGMMDCKKALNETNGDLEAAADWLRTKGIAKADKKASRVAAEGLVAIALDGTTGAVVEVNSETDFVAQRLQAIALLSFSKNSLAKSVKTWRSAVWLSCLSQTALLLVTSTMLSQAAWVKSAF